MGLERPSTPLPLLVDTLLLLPFTLSTLSTLLFTLSTPLSMLSTLLPSMLSTLSPTPSPTMVSSEDMVWLEDMASSQDMVPSSTDKLLKKNGGLRTDQIFNYLFEKFFCLTSLSSAICILEGC